MSWSPTVSFTSLMVFSTQQTPPPHQTHLPLSQRSTVLQPHPVAPSHSHLVSPLLPPSLRDQLDLVLQVPDLVLDQLLLPELVPQWQLLPLDLALSSVVLWS